ncbi:MAG: hypothetical protein JSU63_17840 [Phycisphaerales bacterium]|nr:MAG: hypothetical protein JSU63_17840 [Phycisphaerales bacterium]
MITAILILVLIVLALWHFVCDGIMAPSLRLRVRYKLFAIRDSLRALQSRDSEIGSGVFRMLHENINTAIELVPALSVSLIVKAEQRFREDPELREWVDARVKILDSCPIEEVHVIRDRMNTLVRDALFINAAGWLIWLVPIAGIFHLVRSIPKVVVLPIQKLQDVAPTSFQSPATAPAP